MGTAPLSRLVFAEFTPKYVREINQEYHLELPADSSQLVKYHEDSLRLQAEFAAVNLRRQAEIADRLDEANSKRPQSLPCSQRSTFNDDIRILAGADHG